MSSFPTTILLASIAASLLFGFRGTNGIQQSTTPSARETSYKYDVSGVRLRGNLILRQVFGSPGYGETPARDAKDSIFVLKLSQPISVEPRENAEANGSVDLDPVKNLREVQLFISSLQIAEARRFVGHKVTATGTLNESITAAQYTRVWMDVKTFGLK